MNDLSSFLTRSSVPHVVVASLEATAVSKKDKLKAQQKAAQSAPPQSQPVQQHKKIIDMGIKYRKIEGLNDSCIDVAHAVLAELAANKPYSAIQTAGVTVDGVTYRLPVQYMTSDHGDLRGIFYFRLDDKTNKKHWRFYYKADRSSIALLDIYDKDSNTIPKEQMDKLARLSRAFDGLRR